MRDCPNAEIRDLLPDVVSGRISAPDRARVDAHLATCAECRAELALLESVKRSARTPAIDVDAIARKVASMSPVRTAEQRKQATRLRYWRIAAAFGGIAIAGLTAKKIADANHPAIYVSRDTNPPVRSSVKPPQHPATTGAVSIDVPADTRDLSTEELQQLLNNLQNMDAVPETEPAQLVTPPDGGGVL